MLFYNDPQIGEQFVRAHTFFNSSGKIQQIIIGKESAVDSFTAKKFYKSLYINEGFKRLEGSIKDEWHKYTSPMGIFTTFLPEKMLPYVPHNVKITQADSSERMSIRFYDPVWKHSTFYNIYGYKLNKNMKYLHVENMLNKKHVLRHRFESADVEMKRSTDSSEFPVIEAEYSIEPPKNHPYIKHVKLHAQFLGEFVIVHEIMGTPDFVNSSFMENIVSNVAFHPGQPTP